MSEKKQTEKHWKAEELRAERKARLAKMKSPDGGKKPLRQVNPVKRTITALIIVLIIVLVVAWGAVRMGVPHRNLNALTVGSEKIKVVELNYYYRSLLSQYGIDPGTADGQSALKSDSGVEGFKSVADFILDQAAQDAQDTVILTAYAREQGIELDTEDYAVIENYRTNLEASARQAGQTLDNYLISVFGPGMNWSELERILQRSLLAGKGGESIRESMDFSEEELQSKYEDSPADYDVVDYRMFYFAAGFSSDATDAEKTKAMEKAKEQADEMLDKITDSESFRELSIEYATEEERENYAENDITLRQNRNKAGTNPLVVANWLFADERQPGDKEVVESTSGYYVLYMIERMRPEYRYVSVRHILISADKNNAEADVIDQAKAEAESILADFLAGEQTEDIFAQLAVENSDDGGSAANGGLYENVYPGQTVKEFEEWCFDPGRKSGDTDIVQTDFGFHIMYFGDYEQVAWKAGVEQVLTGEKFQEHMEEAKKEWPYSLNGFAAKFID